MLINHLDSSFFLGGFYWSDLVDAAGAGHCGHKREPFSSQACGPGCCNRQLPLFFFFNSCRKTFDLMFTLLSEKSTFYIISLSCNCWGRSFVDYNWFWSHPVNLKTSPTVAAHLNSCLHVTSSNRRRHLSRTQRARQDSTDMSQTHFQKYINILVTMKLKYN